MGLLYYATSKTTGKKYVGVTSKTLEKRKSGHFRTSKLKKYEHLHFYRAAKKYGWDDFEWSILCTSENMDMIFKFEDVIVDKFDLIKKGYNSAPGGIGGTGKKEVSLETRAKLSAAAKGRKLSPEACAKIGDRTRGRKVSPETKAKTSASLKGRKMSPEFVEKCKNRKATPETCAKISAANIGRKHSAETKDKISKSHIGKTYNSGRKKPIGSGTKSKTVICLEDGKIYESVNSAARYYGIQSGNLSVHLNGKAKMCGGKH